MIGNVAAFSGGFKNGTENELELGLFYTRFRAGNFTAACHRLLSGGDKRAKALGLGRFIDANNGGGIVCFDVAFFEYEDPVAAEGREEFGFRRREIRVFGIFKGLAPLILLLPREEFGDRRIELRKEIWVFLGRRSSF